MNRRLINLIFVLFAVIVLNNSTQAQQLGSHYFWINAIDVGKTPVDSVFKQRWEYATVYADSNDVWIRVGAPDTTNWSSRPYFKLREGTSIEFLPFINLRRLEFYSDSTSAKLYIIGFKRRPQF